MAECGQADQPTLDLSDQLRGCGIASTDATRLRSANELVSYRHRVEWATRSGYARIEDDRGDMVEFGAAGQPTLDLSDQLRGCSIASTDATRLRSAIELV